MELLLHTSKRFFNKSSTCPCGVPDESREHMVYDCDLWKTERLRGFPKDFDHFTSIREYLNFFSSTVRDYYRNPGLMCGEPKGGTVIQ
ncbi:hypothetical protein CEXT_47481 [Caerostris extrusa]|uniref:Reverse transcriptase n=1 Tax=Caerostris extrusa TaxID=172846 RepID=A0AAV4VKL1_CAEEX|nr:hypothetical protein CEXT_47481 [Caerostris extrusa]